MLLTISYNGENAADIGYLLHKNPYRPQVFELNHGEAYVFYPELTDQRASCALLIKVNPVDLARGKVGSGAGGLFDYVNDRPYVSSSFLSTAIARVFGTAMTGRCDKRQALADQELELEAEVHMLPCRCGMDMLARVFEPLGYQVRYEGFTLDERFPDWGESCYVNLTIKGCVRLRDLLKHLYVLIPAFDRQKHYWIGSDEVEKLLRHGEGWLSQHPEREFITRGYLNKRRVLVNLALERLAEVDDALPEPEDDASEQPEQRAERKTGLNQQRLSLVAQVLGRSGAESVIDLGCGEGKLIGLLIKDRQFKRIAGMDVSHAVLERAASRLHLDENETISQRVQLMQGSLTYRDRRLEGYDAACVMEVIEHLDPARLSALERVVFEFAHPKMVIVTTPNIQYNQNYENLLPGRLRHSDHRFEWTRAEFRRWADAVASRFGYGVEYQDIGDVDEKLGAPTQMGVFVKCSE